MKRIGREGVSLVIYFPTCRRGVGFTDRFDCQMLIALYVAIHYKALVLGYVGVYSVSNSCLDRDGVFECFPCCWDMSWSDVSARLYYMYVAAFVQRTYMQLIPKVNRPMNKVICTMMGPWNTQAVLVLPRVDAWSIAILSGFIGHGTYFSWY